MLDAFLFLSAGGTAFLLHFPTFECTYPNALNVSAVLTLGHETQLPGGMFALVATQTQEPLFESPRCQLSLEEAPETEKVTVFRAEEQQSSSL